ncbi:transposase [Listeria monocytogenes]|nr:transposase [Listeria monocytogenes]
MTKHTIEKKLEIVRKYLNSEGGYHTLSRQTGIDTASIRKWVRVYELHGPSALKGGGRSFSGSFKLNVLNYMEEHSLSFRETADYFNIGSHQTIIKWYNIFMDGDQDKLYQTNRGRPPMKKHTALVSKLLAK